MSAGVDVSRLPGRACHFSNAECTAGNSAWCACGTHSWLSTADPQKVTCRQCRRSFRMRLARLTYPDLLDAGLRKAIDWDAYVVVKDGKPSGVDRRRMLADHPKGVARLVVDEYWRRQDAQDKKALP